MLVIEKKRLFVRVATQPAFLKATKMMLTFAEVTRIGGRYRIKHLLGGGDGPLLAEDENLGRDVVLRTVSAHDPGSISSHPLGDLAKRRYGGPSLVNVYAAFDEGGQRWLAIEYVDGESLEARRKSGRSLSLRETVAVVDAASSVLAAALELKLKPIRIRSSDIVVGHDGRIRIVWLSYVKGPPLSVHSLGHRSALSAESLSTMWLAWMTESLLVNLASSRSDHPGGNRGPSSLSHAIATARNVVQGTLAGTEGYQSPRAFAEAVHAAFRAHTVPAGRTSDRRSSLTLMCKRRRWPTPAKAFSVSWPVRRIWRPMRPHIIALGVLALLAGSIAGLAARHGYNAQAPVPTRIAANRPVSPGATTSAALPAAPHIVFVPNLVGMSEDSALVTVRDAGLIVASESRAQNSLPLGRVFSQSPPSGSTLPRFASVALVISAGPASTATSVPPPTATAAVPTPTVVPTPRPPTATAVPANGAGRHRKHRD